MNVTYTCPHCSQGNRQEFTAETRELSCRACQGKLLVTEESVTGEKVLRCLCCPSTDLFVRKDFPQRVGVGLVILGFAISCVTWQFRMVYATFGVLFATAAADLLLYLLVGVTLVCYRCGASYRGVEMSDVHRPFSLETHERYRQQAARLPGSAERAAR